MLVSSRHSAGMPFPVKDADLALTLRIKLGFWQAAVTGLHAPDGQE
jgi:hypothetical protein